MRQTSWERETPSRASSTRKGSHHLHCGDDREPCKEWCRLGRRPWYDQGWFWALLSVAGLALVAWQLGNIHQALETSAEATRQQTGAAIMERTQGMREWGAELERQFVWILEHLRAVGRAIAALGGYLREALPVFRSG